MLLDQMKFAYPWRPYQHRILQDLGRHLTDKRLHVIAPPGSGKTVLGLEAMRQIGQPTLILSPTLAIRDQWASRLQEDFLPNGAPSPISFDLSAPAEVTFTTYQAVYAAYRKGAPVSSLLKQAGVKTLIVDECHHLQKAWWKSLIELNLALAPHLIALTATPPYDASSYEWQRYQELCGPADEEITTPELIQEGNLCPHQDYIWFSLPEATVQAPLRQFHSAIDELITHLKSNYTFRHFLKAHPWLIAPESYLEEIYDAPGYFSALLITLEGIGGAAPTETVGILGDNHEAIPELTRPWLETFLNQAIYRDPYFQKFHERGWFKSVVSRLQEAGAIDRKKVYLEEPPQLERAIQLSPGKLDSIGQILQLEFASLGSALRMLILTDYIRAEALPRTELDERPLQQIGVAPIFEYLRRHYPVRASLGVLTGSMAIIPEQAKNRLLELLPGAGLSQASTTYHTPGYLVFHISGKQQAALFKGTAQLFEEGHINVLIGTNALLGEGWDAPAANTLVLATVVKSFVSSNQARGRVIRTYPARPEKAANIWHLACIDPFHKAGGMDWLKLTQRLKAFSGPTFDPKPNIENGVGRFRLPAIPNTFETVQLANRDMQEHARDRARLTNDWSSGIAKGHHMAEAIRMPIARSRRHLKQKTLYRRQADTTAKAALKKAAQQTHKAVLFSAFGLVALAFLPEKIVGLLPALSLCCSAAALASICLYWPSWKAIVRAASEFVPTSQWAPAFRKLLFAWASSAILAGLIGGTVVGFGLLLLSGAITIMAFGLRPPEEILGALSRLDWSADPQKAFQACAQTVWGALLQQGAFTSRPTLRFHLHAPEEPACYLEGAWLQEEQLFLQCLSIFLSPVDNPRYLLKQKILVEGVAESAQYYAVPDHFGQRRPGAELFLRQARKHFPNGHLSLVYTRTYEGRRTLLAARSQTLSDPTAHRQMAWR